MRNLDLKVRQAQRTGVDTVSQVWCKDPDSREIYTVDTSGKIYKLNKEENSSQLLLDLRCEGLLEDGGRCVNICPLPELQALLLATSAGALIQVGVTGPGDVEEVGAVSAGVLALDLSPDSEIISLVTSDMNLILMTRDYTPLSETQIHQDEFGEGKFVNVGWGAKETQFHGSEGKQARSRKVEAGQVTEGDDGLVRLSWRGDGEMLSVSYVTPVLEEGQAPIRRIRVFDRQGTLYSTSEDCNGLEHTLSWKPSGNLIATTIRKPNKYVVGFFEKNGLQHGEFPLRTEGGQVLDLTWNCDSSILAASCVVTGDPGRHKKLIQFWTVSNYHWHLKQEVMVQQVDTSAGGDQELAVTGNICPRWDAEDPYVFHYMSSVDGVEHFNTLTFARDTDCSVGRSEDDLAAVAVTDGRLVRVTPMREAVIPPPMCAYEIHVDSPVVRVMFQHVGNCGQTSFGLTASSNNLAVMTSSKLYLFEVMDSEKDTKNVGDNTVKITGAGGNGYIVKTSRHTLSKVVAVSKHLTELCNYTWIENNIFASTNVPVPAILTLQESEGKLEETNRSCCEDSVYSLTPGSDNNLFVQLTDGSLLKYQDESMEPVLKWQRVCSSVISVPAAGVLGLNSSGKLYLNEKELIGNITSMFLHSHFLLTTTMDHRLMAVSLEDLGGQEVKFEEAASRRVERGSRLVCAVPQGSRTILQMPRGNLETIQPRSLTIHLLKDLLNQLRFKESFLLARRQRINLNLLVDHDHQLFMDNIETFVSQVNSEPEHLNIFLADLKEENVCTTMYSAQYKNKQKQDWPDKVAKVCSGVRQVLETEGEADNRNLVPILATLVRQGNMLELALHRIQKLRDLGKQDLCDQGLRYVLYSVDVNVLFNIALGTYDFELVLMVAEKSQKDPKEYLPILNKYKSMPEDYMKYSIDKDLKRFESALHHIARCPDNFEECLSLIKDQRLYKKGMKLFPQGSDNYKCVCKIYGEYMEGKRYYLEASYLYEQAGDLDSAVRTSESGDSWERAGHLARAAAWPQDSFQQLARDLATKLEQTDRGIESAIIWREWLKDTEESIAVLARTRNWFECVRQAREAGRQDLLETHVIPGLADRKQTLAETLQANKHKIQQQVARLELVRATRSSRRHEDDLPEDEPRNLEDADLFSDTTSVGGSVATSAKSKSTLATRTSNRSKSGKNRRKQERKLYSTKEGSAHEDLGLIAELHETLSKIPTFIAEVATITRMCLELCLLDDAVCVLQQDADTLLNLAEESKSRIWPGQQVVKERFGPDITVQDILMRGGLAADNNEYRSPLELMEAHLRFPPRFSVDPHWKLQLL